MEDKFLNLEVITPEAIEYSDRINLLLVPGAMGRLGILPGHASLVTIIEKGNIMIRDSDNSEIYMKIGEGLLEVHSDNLTLLVDFAEEIDKDNYASSDATEQSERRDNSGT